MTKDVCVAEMSGFRSGLWGCALRDEEYLCVPEIVDLLVVYTADLPILMGKVSNVMAWRISKIICSECWMGCAGKCSVITLLPRCGSLFALHGKKIPVFCHGEEVLAMWDLDVSRSNGPKAF